MEDKINELVKLSQYAGSRPYFVQGGGGNCSVKTSDSMLIKSSGVFLEDVTHSHGFVVVNLNGDVISNNGYKPSLETAIHLLLGTYVIHTHPILTGGILCCRESKNLTESLFPDSIWLEYKKPGKSTAHALSEEIKNKDVNDLIIFVENHGLFISNSSFEECIKNHDNVILKLKQFFNFEEDIFNNSEIEEDGFLTPDHVVYSFSKNNISSTYEKEALNDLNIYSSAVHNLLKNKSFNVKYLSEENVNEILNMEEEKYRKNLLKENN